MLSTKLSITCKAALAKKYDKTALAKIDQYVAKWQAADKTRGIRTIHVALDDAKVMKPLKVKPVLGKFTPHKAKRALDALVARLKPDYIVLFGANDVVPQFHVPNPTKGEDNEATVPTDNPYASSRKFRNGTRATYLVPDRVVGRIPDLVGSSDPRWVLDYLAGATEWTSSAPGSYGKDLLVVCDEWKQSGQACAQYLSRDVGSLMISPPTATNSEKIRARHGNRLQMIKCHGAANDSCFYGQKGASYPETLRSPSIRNRTSSRTIVGAMCCFGASIFDPNDPAALKPGEPPIPSVYLRQGAFGFFGSTSTAWVGIQAMMCADWVVSAFLKGTLAGASIGRSALEAKQDFVRWLQQQGDEQDAPDEKTLLQFVLLGDPSIHPVKAQAPAGLASASLLGATSTAGAVMARRQRRAVREQLGAVLRSAVPQRQAVAQPRAPTELTDMARQLMESGEKDFVFDYSAPRVERVSSRIVQPILADQPAAAGIRGGRSGTRSVVRRRTVHYYWTATRHRGPVREIQVISIQTDPIGNLLRTKVMVSSAKRPERKKG